MATSTDQKLMKTTKFPLEFAVKVDMNKVNRDVIKQWVASKIIAILDNEDDVVVELAVGMLEERFPNPKSIQLQLMGFLEKDTYAFCKQLWDHLISAQNSKTGVPQALVDAKKAELQLQKSESKQRTEHPSKLRESAERKQIDSDAARQSGRGGRRNPEDINPRFTNSNPHKSRRGQTRYSSPPRHSKRDHGINRDRGDDDIYRPADRVSREAYHRSSRRDTYMAGSVRGRSRSIEDDLYWKSHPHVHRKTKSREGRLTSPSSDEWNRESNSRYERRSRSPLRRRPSRDPYSERDHRLSRNRRRRLGRSISMSSQNSSRDPSLSSRTRHRRQDQAHGRHRSRSRSRTPQRHNRTRKSHDSINTPVHLSREPGSSKAQLTNSHSDHGKRARTETGGVSPAHKRPRSREQTVVDYKKTDGRVSPPDGGTSSEEADKLAKANYITLTANERREKDLRERLKAMAMKKRMQGNSAAGGDVIG